MATFNVGQYSYQSPYNPNRYQVQGSPYSYVGVNPWAAALLDNTPATTPTGATVQPSGEYGSGANAGNPDATGSGTSLGDMSLADLQGYSASLQDPTSMASMTANVAPMAIGITGRVAAEMLGMPTSRAEMQGAVASEMANRAGFSQADVGLAGTAPPGSMDPVGASMGNPGMGSGPAAGPGVAGADTSGTAGTAGIGPGTGVGTEAGAGQADAGSCVIATYLTEAGVVPFSMKRDWVRYCITQKHGNAIGEAQRRGYLTWARPLVKALRRSQAATKVFAYLGQRYADHISGRGSLIGAVIKYTLEPISTLIGMVKR